jgi:hypothetical protein
MSTKTVLNACALGIALVTVAGCAAYGDRLRASPTGSTAERTAAAGPANAPLDRLFFESDHQVGASR